MRRPLTAGILFALAAAGGSPAAATSGCWEGTVGDGPPAERHVFLELADDGAATLFIVDGELKEAPGTLASEGSTLRGAVTRGDDELPLVLEHEPERGTLVGSVVHPAAGELPLALRAATPVDRPERVLGSWSGTLEAVGLSLVVRIDAGPCGRPYCHLDSPDQGAMAMPCTAFSFDGEAGVSFALSFLGASYEGTIRDGDTLGGTFTQGAALPLKLERGATPEGPKRPQEPKPPFPYEVEEVAIDNAAAGITLAGTLSVPPGDGPHPLAILITGSGPQDRDESLAGHKPFLLIADTLTRAGVAVLRTDDRGVGGSGGDTLQSTIEAFAGDVEAQIAWARERDGIDAKRIGLLGHSEGAWVAPLVENRVDDLAFLVFVAGPGLSGREILELQTARILELAGVTDAARDAVLRYNAVIYDAVRRESDNDAAIERIVKGWTGLDAALEPELLDEVYAAMATPRDDVETHLRGRVMQMVGTPWFRHLLGFDPKRALRRVDVPVLALLGGKDVQVPAAENAAALRGSLRAARRDDVRIEVLEGLNHLLQEAPTGSMMEYGSIEETMSPRALEAIRSWVVEVVGLEGE